MPVIYSSCANNMEFVNYEQSGRIATAKVAIVIKGKANVQNSVTFETARGVATIVSDDELELLKANKSFMEAVKGGYFAIDEKATHGHDAEKVGADLKRDGSAQDNEKTYLDSGKKAPKEEKDKK